ncbi:uncharacterized protein LOC122009199 isoform X2 [Zingiber officinale]|uniref:uncharacterized protein LOC122009199 isoform X2 n=1 Tax=Zingiber officinale TaxID=94328 RepID=UPI001C4AE687|nr:uncharacterized protein LOC122009199 isoform X2 [Zingiber officinale]
MRRAFGAGWRRTHPRPPPMPRDPFLHAAAMNKQVEALRGDGRRRRHVASAGRRMHPCTLPVCENESTRSMMLRSNMLITMLIEEPVIIAGLH